MIRHPGIPLKHDLQNKDCRLHYYCADLTPPSMINWNNCTCTPATDDVEQIRARITAHDNAYMSSYKAIGAMKADIFSLLRIVDQLRAERDDYKSRWEQTGCTRHHAMETAVGLCRKYEADITQLKAELAAKDRTIERAIGNIKRLAESCDE